MSGKGSKRRPQQISDDELAQRWAMAFGRKQMDDCEHVFRTVFQAPNEVEPELRDVHSACKKCGLVRFATRRMPTIVKPPPPPDPPPLRVLYLGLLTAFSGDEDDFIEWQKQPFWRRMFGLKKRGEGDG